MRIAAVALSHARFLYRVFRKRAKRIWSAVWLIALTLRNLVSRASVLGDGPALVSLTSYGSRVRTVAYTVESIAAGTTRPARLILWLDDAETYRERPRSLRRLENRGLEVLFSENYGPHTKYFPSLPLVDQGSRRLVTADDDLLYPRDWLAGLIRAAEQYPDVVNCYRASVLALANSAVAPYANWPQCHTTEPSLTHFATGVSGIIYPPAMVSALLAAGTEFVEHCPRADDIWLHWIELRAGVPVRQLANRAVHFPFIPRTQQQTLVSENVAAGGNDRSLAGLYKPADIAVLREAGATDVSAATSS